jgi:hypothetical protein
VILANRGTYKPTVEEAAVVRISDREAAQRPPVLRDVIDPRGRLTSVRIPREKSNNTADGDPHDRQIKQSFALCR